MGITSSRDHFVIDMDRNQLLERIKEFADLRVDDQLVRNKYFGDRLSTDFLSGDSNSWTLANARVELQNEDHEANIKSISYRPFDERFIYYSKKVIDRGREEVMENLIENNIALVCVKIGRDKMAHNYFITKSITDKSVTSSLDNANVFPLYEYPETVFNNGSVACRNRIPNLDRTILKRIEDNLYLTFSDENEESERTFSPTNLMDYIYAILYSSRFRQKYIDYLKVDLPRIPYPQSLEAFRQLVEVGRRLRQVHLLESPAVNTRITTFPISGDNVVRTLKYKDGKVFINEAQYFDRVPEIAWNSYIGGYQPAQKWLKDRKAKGDSAKGLSFEDIILYQKIIVALVETDRLMQEIDQIEVE